MSAAEPKLLLTADEAARSLSICRKSLWSRTQPRGPIPCVRFGSSVRYSIEALRRFVREQEAFDVRPRN